MTRTTKEQFIDFAGDEPEKQDMPLWLIVAVHVLIIVLVGGVTALALYFARNP